jgi:hypothetical protein
VSKKFSILANAKGEAILDSVVASIRTGLAEGFKTTLKLTTHDSSNAGTHWLIGVGGKTRPGARTYGQYQDLRGKGDPLVGSRGDRGSNKNSNIEKVLDKEIREVIAKYAAGNKPETNFYFYNSIGDVKGYRDNAGILTAGESGIKQAVAAFEREIRSGKVLKRRRKLG